MQLNSGTIALDYTCYNKACKFPVFLMEENIHLMWYASYEMLLHILHALIKPQLVMAICWSSQVV